MLFVITYSKTFLLPGLHRVCDDEEGIASGGEWEYMFLDLCNRAGIYNISQILAVALVMTRFQDINLMAIY